MVCLVYIGRDTTVNGVTFSIDDLPTAISSEKPLADGLSVGIDGLSVTYNGIPGADQISFNFCDCVPFCLTPSGCIWEQPLMPTP